MTVSMRLVKSRRSKDSCFRSGRLAAGFNRSLQRLNNTRPSPLDGTLLLLGVGRNKAISGLLIVEWVTDHAFEGQVMTSLVKDEKA